MGCYRKSFRRAENDALTIIYIFQMTFVNGCLKILILVRCMRCLLLMKPAQKDKSDLCSAKARCRGILIISLTSKCWNLAQYKSFYASSLCPSKYGITYNSNYKVQNRHRREEMKKQGRSNKEVRIVSAYFFQNKKKKHFLLHSCFLLILQISIKNTRIKYQYNKICE